MKPKERTEFQMFAFSEILLLCRCRSNRPSHLRVRFRAPMRWLIQARLI